MKEIFTINNHHDVMLSQTIYHSTRITIKNKAIAERIAGILGGVVRDVDALRNDRTGRDQNYIVPVNALSRTQAKQYGVFDHDSILGGIVSHAMQAEKGALHPPVSPDALVPPWYSRSFANRLQVADAILPGFTVFTEDDAQKALNSLRGDGFSVRFKKVPETSGRGQFPVTTPDQLQEVIHKDFATFLECGAVLEAGMRDPTEVNLAVVRMDGEQYSWIGTPSHESGFQTDLTVVRGDFSSLADHLSDPNQHLAVKQAQTVFETYRWSGAVMGRSAFDVLQGNVADNTFVSGVVDPTMRVGGSTPAELRAIEALRQFPDVTEVRTAIVTDHTHSPEYKKRGYEVFAQDPDTDIYVKLIDAA